MFMKYGEISKMRLKEGFGYAFIQYKYYKSASQAIKNLDGV